MLFPPKIARLRIDVSLQTFFEDLEVYCKTKNWQFDKPIFKDKLWHNNLVKIEEIDQYDDGRPKGFNFTYYIPSPVNPPRTGLANLTDNPPIIGTEHQIYVRLNMEYPDMRFRENPLISDNYMYIGSRSMIWHTRFYPKKESWGCIMVNGEIDRIAMNLFGQLLWHADKVWKVKESLETTNNYAAKKWGIKDKIVTEKFMETQMTKMWGKK